MGCGHRPGLAGTAQTLNRFAFWRIPFFNALGAALRGTEE
jgi:hypothetical protein